MNLSPQMMQHHLTQNYFSGQSRTVYYKSNLSCLPTQPPPATNHAVEANNSRIQAMESTIKHLRVLLQNEIKSKKRESDMFDSVKAELEELKEQKLVLEKKLALVHEEANKEIILKCDEVKKEADSQLRFITEELREKEEQLDQLHKENEKLRQELEGAAKDNTHFVSLNQQLRAKVNITLHESFESLLAKSLVNESGRRSTEANGTVGDIEVFFGEFFVPRKSHSVC